MKGHPVFIAQHATATCCRGFLWKWHRIEKGRALSDSEIKFVVELVIAWISIQIQVATFNKPSGPLKTNPAPQLPLQWLCYRSRLRIFQHAQPADRAIGSLFVGCRRGRKWFWTGRSCGSFSLDSVEFLRLTKEDGIFPAFFQNKCSIKKCCSVVRSLLGSRTDGMMVRKSTEWKTEWKRNRVYRFFHIFTDIFAQIFTQ